MADLFRELTNDANWRDVQPFPSITDYAEQYMDIATANRVSDITEGTFGYAGVAIDSLDIGDPFPDLDDEAPLLHVTLDSHVAGPEQWIERQLESAPYVQAGTGEGFTALAPHWELYGSRRRRLVCKLGHPLGAAAVVRNSLYVVASAQVDEHFVGLRGDQTSTRIEEPGQFTSDGDYEKAEIVPASWDGNIVLPRLIVGERYERPHLRDGGLERLRVASARLIWRSQQLPIIQPANPTDQAVLRIPGQRKGE